MIAQAHNRFVFCVVVVEFAVNGNQALAWGAQADASWEEVVGVGSGDFLPRTVKNQIPPKPELKMLGVRINLLMHLVLGE